jgi:hypothetical protein
MSEMEQKVAEAIEANLNADRSLYGTESRRVARAAIKVVRESLLAIVAQEEETFLSPEYATGQPLSSFSERFACQRVAKAIDAALTPSRAPDEGRG